MFFTGHAGYETISPQKHILRSMGKITGFWP